MKTRKIQSSVRNQPLNPYRGLMHFPARGQSSPTQKLPDLHPLPFLFWHLDRGFLGDFLSYFFKPDGRTHLNSRGHASPDHWYPVAHPSYGRLLHFPTIYVTLRRITNHPPRSRPDHGCACPRVTICLGARAALLAAAAAARLLASSSSSISRNLFWTFGLFHTLSAANFCRFFNVIFLSFSSIRGTRFCPGGTHWPTLARISNFR
jgi:hypothetical protein